MANSHGETVTSAAGGRILDNVCPAWYPKFIKRKRGALVLNSSDTTFRLQFLGSGDTFCNGGRANQAILCSCDGKDFLVDCGPTTSFQAQRFNVDFSNLETIFFTHIHGDHVFGLPLLVLHLQFVVGRTRPLSIVMPRGYENFPDRLLWLGFPDVMERGLSFDLLTRPLDPSDGEVEIGGMTVRGVHMSHSVPVVGYRFSHEGKTIAISGDTRMCDGLVELADGVDLLITEASYATTIPEVPHQSLDDLKVWAPRLNAKRIAVVHTDTTFDTSPYEAPNDGDVLEV